MPYYLVVALDIESNQWEVIHGDYDWRCAKDEFTWLSIGEVYKSKKMLTLKDDNQIRSHMALKRMNQLNKTLN